MNHRETREPEAKAELSADALRWRCDPEFFPFDTTAEIRPIQGVVGQDAAIDALRFGLECFAPGQNIYVRGLTGTGRMTLIRRLLDDIKPNCPNAPDRVYVHNFDEPWRPRLIVLPRGQAAAFAKAMDHLIQFIEDDLAGELSSESFRERLQALRQATQEKARKLMQPLEESLRQSGLALVTINAGEVTRPAIFPRIDDRPVPPETYDQEYRNGNITKEAFEATLEAVKSHLPRLEGLSRAMISSMEEFHLASRKLLASETRALLDPFVAPMREKFRVPEVWGFLDRVIDELIDRGVDSLSEADEPIGDCYRVNPVLSHREDEPCPIVVENVPTAHNLVGGIDRWTTPDTKTPPSHMHVRPGSLLAADGGYLIIEARDVLAEPGAWKALIRTLRTRKLEIGPSESAMAPSSIRLKPEPIDVSIRVILVGDPDLFYVLSEFDPDFVQLFKVLAEFDTVTPRTNEALMHYAGVIRRLTDEEKLPPFRRDAVAALAEHGARIAASHDKLTTRFSRLADIAREAAFVANTHGHDVVTGDDVRETVRRTKRRAELPSRKFRELMADGTIRIQTDGRAIGQINGLAVITAGALTYGFPARITATIGAGSTGVINIDRESSLSGALHTKGFLILSGLLRHMLQTNHPLTFDASLAFEQSYGRIDGDSASGAEICCLISALTNTPIRQDLAITGAIDQHGNLLAIGGVNEKIEGFFDVCRDVGFNGAQGVIIPAANAGDLMLRHDVVEACRAGEFHVYAVATVSAALELLTGVPAGEPGEDHPGSLIALARRRAREYWSMTAARRPLDSDMRNNHDGIGAMEPVTSTAPRPTTQHGPP